MDGNDVRVVEGSDGLGLSLGTPASLLVGRKFFGEHFQRHLSIETRVFGDEDFAHTAAADLFQDLEVV